MSRVIYEGYYLHEMAELCRGCGLWKSHQRTGCLCSGDPMERPTEIFGGEERAQCFHAPLPDPLPAEVEGKDFLPGSDRPPFGG